MIILVFLVYSTMLAFLINTSTYKHQFQPPTTTVAHNHMCCKTVFLMPIIVVKYRDTCVVALLILCRFRYKGCFFSYLTDCQPNALVGFY